jgi:D-alanyl-D-alanine dipeptidase
LLFFGISGLFSPVATLQAQGRNPYNLPLTTSSKAYLQQVDSNPMLQMVNLEKRIPGLRTDIRYATAQNFTRQVLYHKPAVFLRKAAADKLAMVQDSLQKLGLAILVFDGYRPYATTLRMWEIVPDDRYAANPANGSGHNRGIAIDLTLVNTQTGIPLKMPTDFDNFSDSAHHDFPHPDSTVRANRALLKGIMMHFGFRPLETEWWHYSLPEPRRYPLMDLSFGQLQRLTKEDKD